RLLPKVCSRLGMGRIVFAAYTKEQIATIVASRLAGLVAFDKDAVNLAAAKVASISGDVRRALQICRRAAEVADGRAGTGGRGGGAARPRAPPGDAAGLPGAAAVPSPDELQPVVQRLHDARVILAEHVPSRRLPRLRLNIILDDLALHLRADPLAAKLLLD